MHSTHLYMYAVSACGCPGSTLLRTLMSSDASRVSWELQDCCTRARWGTWVVCLPLLSCVSRRRSSSSSALYQKTRRHDRRRGMQFPDLTMQLLVCRLLPALVQGNCVTPRQLSYEDLPRLTYLNAVIDETMRLFPVAATGSVR